MTKKTRTYGASLTPAERREWNKQTDRILAERTARPARCPQCSGDLNIERNVKVSEPMLTGFMIRGAELPRRTRIAYAAAFCCGCEYAVELNKRGQIVS